MATETFIIGPLETVAEIASDSRKSGSRAVKTLSYARVASTAAIRRYRNYIKVIPQPGSVPGGGVKTGIRPLGSVLN